ncbi:uncharacterized protein LOC143860006 [Tasmannia lanceolata]|uniref:uncharacterized protein LOC143860006 n=1 Tax=Tasmannia lanceolata TaxID=3420 RepID=UPI0040645539
MDRIASSSLASHDRGRDSGDVVVVGLDIVPSVVWMATILTTVMLYIQSFTPTTLLLLVSLLLHLPLPTQYLSIVLNMRNLCAYMIDASRPLPHLPNEDLKTGMRIGLGHEIGSLYYLDSRPASAALRTSVDAYQWHCRLGHPPAEKRLKYPF